MHGFRYRTKGFILTNGTSNGRAAYSQKGQITAVYPYKDEIGNLLYENVRFEPKDFRQRHFDNNGKEREGGRVSSKYLGSGELADLLSGFDQFDQLKNRIEAEKQRKERQSFERIDQRINEFEAQVKDLVENFLIEKGFYKTSSRQWRLKGNYDKEKD